MDITVAIGSTDQGHKVHMGYKATGRLLCAFTATAPHMTEQIADLDDEGGQDGTIAVLTANKVAPSRLCAHCFGKRIRSVYAARLRAAREAATQNGA